MKSCIKNRTCFDKKTAFFLLFRRWRKLHTWDGVEIVLRRQRPWCTCTFYALFHLLKEHHERCLLVLDCRRFTPDLLEEWSQTMESHCGAAHDFLCFTDAKPYHTCRPGKGKVANEIMSKIGDLYVKVILRIWFWWIWTKLGK